MNPKIKKRVLASASPPYYSINYRHALGRATSHRKGNKDYALPYDDDQGAQNNKFLRTLNTLL